MKNKILIVTLVVFGLVFSYVAYESISQSIQTRSNSEKTEAKIIAISQTGYPIVQYQVDGVTYKEELSVSNGAMAVGQTVQVYYNRVDPSRVSQENNILYSLLFALAAVIPLIIAAWIILKRRAKTKNQQTLIEQGRRVEASIDSVGLSSTMVGTGDIGSGNSYRNLYIIRCFWDDPVSGDVYTFISDSLTINPQELINRYNINSIPVFYDPQNPRNYFMDLKSIPDITLFSEVVA